MNYEVTTRLQGGSQISNTGELPVTCRVIPEIVYFHSTYGSRYGQFIYVGQVSSTKSVRN